LIIKAEFEATKNQYDKQLVALNKQWTALKMDNEAVESNAKLENIEKIVESIVKLRVQRIGMRRNS